MHTYIFPLVKSFRPVSVDEATVDARGFENDRRFMLITPLALPSYKTSFGDDEATHRFLSQRQCPSLATITATLDNHEPHNNLVLTSDKLPGKSVTIPNATSPTNDNLKTATTATIYRATLWGDVVLVQDMGDAAAEFCQAVVNADESMPDETKPGVRLVRQVSSDTRETDAQYTPASTLSLRRWGARPAVALTDGFPLLLANQASLDELNLRLQVKGKPAIPMSRFRPNIVVQGRVPFEEDYWKVISIDGVVFHIVKGCPRCKQSCTDQETGQVDTEPLETMAEFRATTAKKEDLYFAQNVIAAVASQGKTIRVGANVQVLQRGSPVWET